jgi:hypothetical protein
MKNLLVLTMTLLTCLSVSAQSKLYSTNEYGTSAKQVGKFENGKIYATNEYGTSAKQVGKLENGKIYSTNEYGTSAKQIGKIEGKKVYSTNEYGISAKQVGKYELPEDYLRLGTVSPPDVFEGTQAAAAFLIFY